MSHMDISPEQAIDTKDLKGVVCLCGSTRFFKLFDELNYKLTMNGWVVLSIGCHSQSDYCLGIDQIENAKGMLDRLHKKKIWMASHVLILNKDGYIGDSTRSELEFAQKHERKIYYYDDESYKELLD